MKLRKELARSPFTIVLVVALVAVAIATGPIGGPSALVRDAVGIDLETIARHEWWSFITADFFVDNLAELLAVVVAAVIGVGVSERLMGTRRAIVAFVITGVLGSAIGLAVQAIGVVTGEYWADAVRGLVTVDPLTPVLGTVAVASAFATVLWRRRLRTLVVATTAVFLLYSGTPTDLYRLLAVLVGVVIGTLWTHRRLSITRWTSSHHETRVLMATVVAIFAVGPVITLISHGRFGLLSPLGSFVVDGMPRSRPGGIPCTVGGAGQACAAQLGSHPGTGISAIILALVPLVILLLGAWGLLVGRRAAVYVIAAIATLDGVLAGFYFGVLPVIGQPSFAAQRAGQSPEFAFWMLANAVIPLLLAALVLSQVRHFTVRPIAGAWRAFVVTVGISAVATAAAYVGLGVVIAKQFKPAVGFFDLLADLPERFVPTSFLLAERRVFFPTSMASRLLYHGVGPLFWLAVLIAVIFLLRGPRSSRVLSAQSADVRSLLRRASGSMSFPATWPGNVYWFDDSRTLAIAYRVANGCAVTTGDPIGTSDAEEESLGQFVRFCDANGWTPVFYGIHAHWADVLSTFGWSTVVVAEETIIDPAQWEMTGKRWQDVRSSINRASREGVRASWGSWSSFSVGITSQIADISELWVVDKKLPELGFTLGGLDELRDPDVLLGLAIDSQGKVQAVTSWLPSWRDGVLIGYTLDFMRRRADGINGVMEFLIAEAAVRAKLDGLEHLSLSGAPLAVVERADPTALDRMLAWLGRSLEPVYGFRSLLKFKRKFQPQFSPLSLAYPDAMSLPAIAIAISRCYLPTLTLRETAMLVRSLR